mmetsp:Transcript_30357/g.63838  ORF Transcript_30357/g.63838 Transcript_30357/m.63838 type:complete len:201 (-) Transcript_30357:409-1011(-)
MQRRSRSAKDAARRSAPRRRVPRSRLRSHAVRPTLRLRLAGTRCDRTAPLAKQRAARRLRAPLRLLVFRTRHVQLSMPRPPYPSPATPTSTAPTPTTRMSTMPTPTIQTPTTQTLARRPGRCQWPPDPLRLPHPRRRFHKPASTLATLGRWPTARTRAGGCRRFAGRGLAPTADPAIRTACTAEVPALHAPPKLLHFLRL